MVKRYVLRHNESRAFFCGYNDLLDDLLEHHGNLNEGELTPNYVEAESYNASQIKQFFGFTKCTCDNECDCGDINYLVYRMRKVFTAVSINDLKRDTLLTQAVTAINESWSQDSYYPGQNETMDSGYSYHETWCKIYAHNRDSDLITESNFESYQKLLDDFIKEHDANGDILDDYEYSIHRDSHWACGWVEFIVIPALTSKGEVTEIFKYALSIQGRLDDYPLLDDDDHSSKEYEAAIEFITDNLIPGYLKDDCPDDLAYEIFHVLWDNNIYIEEYGMYDSDSKAEFIILEYCVKHDLVDSEELQDNNFDLYDSYLEYKAIVDREYKDQTQAKLF